MDIRFLRYFLAVAREENISKAAEHLHVTQPTLSRQIAQAEEKMGVKFFERGTRKVTLTHDGLLLRRRAEEILELVDKTEQELIRQNTDLEGTISIGCGDLGAVELLPKLIRPFQEKYPHVRFELYTATAEHVKERMDRGLMDIGLLLGPLNLEKYDAVQVPALEEWVVAMPADSPLKEKETISPQDLHSLPLILPPRIREDSELARWFGSLYPRLRVLFTSNLPSTGLVMVSRGLAYSLIIKGSVAYWNPEKIIFRPLRPALTTPSFLAWKRRQPVSPAVEKFLQQVRAVFQEENL